MLKILGDLLVKSECIELDGFKYFVHELTLIKTQRKVDTKYLNFVLDLLLEIITPEPKQEVFDFLGDNQSGISIIKNLSLPSNGFCFFGWIRIETANKKKLKKPMIIFKFSSSNGKNIEFSFYKGMLVYSVI